MTRSMTIPQLFPDGLSRGFRERDCALLNDSGQFARRADEAADFNASFLAVDHMHRKQRASKNLMVEPHLSDAIEKHFSADRRVKHSNHSTRNLAGTP